MAGFPVVIAANGMGIPVIPVQQNAPLATVATNGLGTPIVLVEDSGHPLIIEGLPQNFAFLSTDDGAALASDDDQVVETY